MLLIALTAVQCHIDSRREYMIQVHNKPLKIRLVDEEKFYGLYCYEADSLTSTWPLPFPVYQFQTGDIDGDGNEDIVVGAIKTTRMDSVIRKRIFLFQVRNRKIIPLWMGSSLAHPLEDFKVVPTDSVTLVRSIEKEPMGQFLVAEYQWYGFGLSFNRYLSRNISLSEAYRQLE